MSHIIFGCFDLDTIDSETFSELKKEVGEEDILLWFGDETNFYPDLSRMVREQGEKAGTLFAITSQRQRYNSDDLLFPYDAYTEDELFTDKTREFFSQCCKNNLKVLFWCLHRMTQKPWLNNLKMFIVEGYDCEFLKKTLDLEEMEFDILAQVLTSYSIDSCIYQIKV